MINMPRMTTAITMEAKKTEDNIGRVYLYDTIKPDTRDWWTGETIESSTDANRIKEQLDGLKDCEKLEVYIASNGGDVRTGLAIHAQLKRMKMHKTAFVDGMACSIASVIPMACDEIIMYSTSLLMIHNASMGVYGNAVELRKAADDLDIISSSAKAAYLEKSGGKISEEKVTELMDAESWLSAEQCLEYGLCDRIDLSAPVADAPEQYAAAKASMCRKDKGNDEDIMKKLFERLDMLESRMAGREAPAAPEPPPEKRDYSGFINAFINNFKL